MRQNAEGHFFLLLAVTLGRMPTKFSSHDSFLIVNLKVTNLNLTPIGTGQHKYKSRYKNPKSEVDLPGHHTAALLPRLPPSTGQSADRVLVLTLITAKFSKLHLPNSLSVF
eukprot:SAG31_NODE_176_length_21334_cov_12.211067_23_plen_111_part_00